jgi:hypothetical protein
MTLEELKTRCEKEGFKYAYSKFEEETEPPHLIAITIDTDNFMADNKVYHKNVPIQLDYTYIYKNVEEQNKIENKILGDIAWNKTEETYLQDEKVWQVSYFFEI